MAFTYFFRDLQTLESAVEYLVPFAMGRQYTRIWNAGCAMGPETYSLAILLAEAMGNFAYRNLQIDATDLDGSDLFETIITSGIYPDDQLQRIPPEIYAKYFEKTAEPGHAQIIEKVRSRVRFTKHDLLSLKPVGSDYSMVVCKNVLLHFSAEERIEVIKMFHKSLVDGGMLVVEQTQKIPPEIGPMFEQVRSNVQVFRKVNI